MYYLHLNNHPQPKMSNITSARLWPKMDESSWVHKTSRCFVHVQPQEVIGSLNAVMINSFWGQVTFRLIILNLTVCVGCSYSKFLIITWLSHKLGPFLDLTWMAWINGSPPQGTISLGGNEVPEPVFFKKGMEGNGGAKPFLLLFLLPPPKQQES